MPTQVDARQQLHDAPALRTASGEPGLPGCLADNRHTLQQTYDSPTLARQHPIGRALEQLDRSRFSYNLGKQGSCGGAVADHSYPLTGQVNVPEILATHDDPGIGLDTGNRRVSCSPRPGGQYHRSHGQVFSPSDFDGPPPIGGIVGQGCRFMPRPQVLGQGKQPNGVAAPFFARRRRPTIEHHKVVHTGALERGGYAQPRETGPNDGDVRMQSHITAHPLRVVPWRRPASASAVRSDRPPSDRDLGCAV
ncbi:Uncharacterised protein [Mycobacteroides abscessus subsp. massiliense]|nr:Uncharacterised protein [Mycobacteroides abscessus subsp. massiliense]